MLKIKSIIIVSDGFILIVLFVAKHGSVTNPIVLEYGFESSTNSGISVFLLPKNFSWLISYSKSPTVSCSVYKFTAKYISLSFTPLFFLFTKILSFSRFSNVINKLLNA